MKIFALGPSGTYGHEAALRATRTLPRTTEISLCDSHSEVFQRAFEKNVFAIVPVENSIEGLVRDTVRDFWLKQVGQPKIRVIGEVSLPISHCLLAREGALLEDITSVLSHPQALGQCQGNLSRLKLMETVPTKSTAGAALLVATDERYRTSAALASRFAGKVHDLEILAERMEDSPGNTTRFHVLGTPVPGPTGDDRTAMLCWLSNSPGSLLSLCYAISREGVNMSSIHSLPLGTAGTYAFYVEFDEHLGSEKGSRICDHLVSTTKKILVLGSYPRQV